MTSKTFIRMLPSLALAAAVLAIGTQDGWAQQALTQGYTYQDTPGAQPGGNTLVLGVAAYQLCQIKNFLFMAVYILAAIAFVVFAVKALFTKFQFSAFLPIIGAIFVVAFSDLLIAFIAPNAWYCPTTLGQL